MLTDRSTLDNSLLVRPSQVTLHYVELTAKSNYPILRPLNTLCDSFTTLFSRKVSDLPVWDMPHWVHGGVALQGISKGIWTFYNFFLSTYPPCEDSSQDYPAIQKEVRPGLFKTFFRAGEMAQCWLCSPDDLGLDPRSSGVRCGSEVSVTLLADFQKLGSQRN